MKATEKQDGVAGIVAPAPRLTPLGAAVLAGCIALPSGAVLMVIELLLI